MASGRPPCTAHRQDGAQCTKIPGEGHIVCRFHGGAAPNVIAAAQVRAFEAKARELLFDYDDERRQITDPFQELLDLASEIVAFKDALKVLLGDLQGRVTQDIGGANNSNTEEVLRPQLIAYERAIDRCFAVNAKIVQLGIEDRMARVSERQAETFARLIDGIVTDLGHNPADPATAGIIGRRLQLATG